MFTYPQSFVDAARDLYPAWKDLHLLLAQNRKEVGELLYNAKGLAIDEDQIISYFKNNKQEKILAAAKRAKAKRELYFQWVEIVETCAEQLADEHGYEL